MAQIHPFLPHRYNPEVIQDLGAVIAPPYDVISETRRLSLIAQDPHNVIRIILPEGDSALKYNHAAELLNSWIGKGVVIQEQIPGIYIYTQSFKHPVTGAMIERVGVLGTVSLEPFSAGIILPHERTLSGPKADRLSLMRSLNGNPEAIFGMYESDGTINSLFSRVKETTPLIEASDADHVLHRIWKIEALAEIGSIQHDLLHQKIYIVDGHHRYETALNYRNEQRENGIGSDEGCHSIMMYLCPMDDTGLVILPTHRIVHSLPSFSQHELLEQVSDVFDITPVQTLDELLQELSDNQSSPTYGMATKTGLYVLKLTNSTGLWQNTEVAEPLRDLDVTVLHEYILEQLLGIRKEDQANQSYLRYAKSVTEAVDTLDEESVQCVFLMNPTKLEQVREVAAQGHVMPQKSTYFYPKLASGLMFNLF